MSGPFVIAAGGTGGHLFPAEALASALIGRGRRVALVTDARGSGFAANVSGVDVYRVRAGRPAGGPLNLACGLAGLALGTVEARMLLRRIKPAAVIGFGGYPSVPTMLAAAHLGLPTMLHEQNAVLGRANRWLAPRVRRIALGFAATAGLGPAERARAIHTGNPVRSAILALGAVAYRRPMPDAPVELLVIGGSQGAHFLAETVPAALALLPEKWRATLRVSQQARSEDLAAAKANYANSQISAEIQSFFADVPNRLAHTQLVICRAGASTIAELAALGRPAILIPYPHATDDHQSANARAFAEAGGGWVMPQQGLDAPSLADRLAALLAAPESLTEAAAAAGRFAPREAAATLADLAIALESGGEPAALLKGCAA